MSETSWAQLRRIYDALPQTSKCRDCDDHDGICPNSELPCDPTARVIALLENWKASEPQFARLRAEKAEIEEQIDDYKEWEQDVRRLTRKIDVTINGSGTAEQATLGDIFGCVQRLKSRAETAEAQVAALAGALKEIRPALGYGYDPAGGKTLGNIVDGVLNNLPAAAERYLKVMEAAKAYRDEEREDTPRMFRGKKLHDLGLALDEALTTKTENAG